MKAKEHLADGYEHLVEAESCLRSARMNTVEGSREHVEADRLLWILRGVMNDTDNLLINLAEK